MKRGRKLPRIVEPGYRGQIGEPKPPVDLSGLRIPGARYRPPWALPPRRDPLFDADTVWPRVPDPYETDQRYRILDRPPYLPSVRYEPEEEEWDYELPQDVSLFDGRALNVFDRGPIRETERLSRATVQELLRQEWEIGVAAMHNAMQNELDAGDIRDDARADLAAASAELAAHAEAALSLSDPWPTAGLQDAAADGWSALEQQVLGTPIEQAFKPGPSDWAGGLDAQANAIEQEFDRQLSRPMSAYEPPADALELLPDPGCLNPLDVPPPVRVPGMRLF